MEKGSKYKTLTNDNIVSPHILHHLYYFATPPTSQGHNFLCFQKTFCIISYFFKKNINYITFLFIIGTDFQEAVLARVITAL